MTKENNIILLVKQCYVSLPFPSLLFCIYNIYSLLIEE